MNAAIKKWGSVGLIVLTIVTMFLSWVKLTDLGEELYRDTSTYYLFNPGFTNELRGYMYSYDFVDEFYYEFGEPVDVNDVNQALDSIDDMQSIFHSLRDGISMPELSKTLGLVNSALRLVDKYPMLVYQIDQEIGYALDDAMDYTDEFGHFTFKDIKSTCSAAGWAFNLLFCLTLAALAATIVMHLFNLKHSGIPAAAGVAALVVVNIVLVSKVGELCKTLNREFSFDLKENFFALTAWPFIALVLAAASVFLWITTGATGAIPVLAAVRRVRPNRPAAATADSWICPKCQAVSGGGVFCPNCGAKRAATIKCPHCGTAVSDDERFCTECGTQLAGAAAQPAAARCPDCGAELSQNEKFCSACGKALSGGR